MQWGRDNFWIYGVVEPLSGWHFEQEYDHLNSNHFQTFLDALSHQLGDDIALIQLDQAKAHQALALKWSENLIPVFQPAHSPELNPIERLWQFLKKQVQGENFATLTQLRARLQQVLNELTFQQVASLTSYDFILEALFYAALWRIGINSLLFQQRPFSMVRLCALSVGQDNSGGSTSDFRSLLRHTRCTSHSGEKAQRSPVFSNIYPRCDHLILKPMVEFWGTKGGFL